MTESSTSDTFGRGFFEARKEDSKDHYIDYGGLMEFLEEMKGKFDVAYSNRLSKPPRRTHASTSLLVDLAPLNETDQIQSKTTNGLIRRMSEGTFSVFNKMKSGDHEFERNLDEDALGLNPYSNVDSHSLTSSHSCGGPANAESDQALFCSLLDDQMEKVGLFFLKEQGRIADSLSRLTLEKARLHKRVDAEKEFVQEETDKLVEGYRSASVELGELFLFAAINMTVLRKLLNRHDAIVRRGDSKPPLLRQWYVLTRTEDKQAYLRPLLSHHGLMALEGTVRRGVSDLKQPEPNPLAVVNRDDDINALINNIDSVAAKMKRAEKRSFNDFVVAGSFGNNIAFEPSILRNKFLPVLDMGDSDMQFYVEWREREKARSQRHFTPNDKTLMWPFGLQLNLVSTFLYMTNYFVAGPTSVEYINALGGHNALASMITGATPWAVLGSTFLYSIWTNHSFKNPLIASGVLLCLGNFFYASALKFQSIELLMGGRMLIGFGGPRLINRRYIADTAELELRTAVSASFVTFSACGTAVGPAISVLMQHVNTKVHVPFLGKVAVNGLTAPGYFMFLLWLVFLFAVILGFDEPTRIGLQQQKDAPKKLEKKALSGPAAADASELEVLVKVDALGESAYGAFPENDHENGGVGTAADLEEDNNLWCLTKISWPVVLCLILLFVDKLAIEAVISSAPIITDDRYEWSVHRIGGLQVTIGMLVIPLSICVGWMSRRFEDGKLLLWLLYFSAFGMLLLVDVNDLSSMRRKLNEYDGLLSVGPHRYIYGCIFSFSGLQAMESIIMSTLSKVVPYSLAVGTCNSGLLNTEIGTLGRAVGDLTVTVLGLASISYLLDLLVVPLLILLVGCIVLVRLNYSIFAHS